ncbi:Zinc finger/binuclear cluster transcriptional regulator [Mycena indigotica]|uniref:Zinc finger/binuclear cluster transcriptional regulator n=1 Tax=Mycena indigotica TaxID=2126181 RepID=A0A8H6T610_9AGAR|nr:Zinc finger/binuclear cluster transcriptional regulator [Mycena indigotica]KAF7311693.1 Zinc finger/binuclear cluster transcriptional regulator [Mycena indigotica]
MGGDHKCPVCQATFTRPQHVARHMRSREWLLPLLPRQFPVRLALRNLDFAASLTYPYLVSFPFHTYFLFISSPTPYADDERLSSDTGDRPYKCVHCGDQFARSDLLSRHVNKCHAGASKAGGASSGRRKGTTAAARATTSKQACDQCVQSSLPCDGSNPCAKCVTRKTRCTFVKFHRQTAPVGPGHPSSLAAAHPSASSMGYSLDMHGLAGAGQGPGQFLYAQQAASGAGFAYAPPTNASPTTSSPPFSLSAGSREGLPHFSHPHHFGEYRDREAYDSYDYDRYDALDASSEHSGSVSAGSRPASSAGLSDYGGYHPHLPGANGRQASLDMHHPHSHARPPDGPHHGHRSEFSSAFGLMSLDDPNVLAGLAADGVPFFSTTSQSPVAPHAHIPGLQATPTQNDKHRLGLPLPLQLPLIPAPPALTFQAPHPHQSSYGPPPPGSAGSSSGHGHGHPAQTPGTREAETRELREFWKAYMRTPLTGPSPGQNTTDPLANVNGGLGMETPSASASNAANAAGGLLGTSGPPPRRYRVSSLPSVKTPEGEMDAPPVFPVHHHQQHAPPVSQQHQPPRTMHNADDLRSYEAAVLARKAPELVLRKPVKQRPLTSHGSASPPTRQSSQPQPSSSQPTQQSFDFNAMSRESSNSLAGAFGQGQNHSFSYNVPPPGTSSSSTGSNPASPFPNTPSSDEGSREDDGDDGGSTTGSGGSNSGRPSFKRLPSQTLEPVHSKRRRDMGMTLPGGLGMETPTPELLGVPSSYAGERQLPPQRRARRLSAPASPTALGFVIN